MRWDGDKRYWLTHHTEERGRFSSYPYLPYNLRANYEEYDVNNRLFKHNDYGFRGNSFKVNKPEGTVRIVAVGASAVYGIWVTDEDTFTAQLENIFQQHGQNVEVLNAGVPGWTSQEVFINFYLRVLNLNPDIIIYYQGRNDLFPQAFNNYISDYQHFRRPDYSFRYTNYLHKYLFKVSELFLVLSYWGDGQFGYSRMEENPVYGVIKFENRPANDQLIKNLSELHRIDTFRNNLESIVHISHKRGIKVLLSSYAMLVNRYASGYIRKDESILPKIEEQMNKINDTIKDIALKHNVAFLDTALMLSDDMETLLVDDCHFNREGELARAKLFYDKIAPLVQEIAVN
jgi:lysophospholipase L1-like esterase